MYISSNISLWAVEVELMQYFDAGKNIRRMLKKPGNLVEFCLD